MIVVVDAIYCYYSDSPPSAAELFRLPPPRSGTHCRTISSP